MPYITGTANTLAELRGALVSACTANGWSWNSSTEVLSKAGRFSGKDLFVRLQISGAFLTLLGRTSALAGDAPRDVKIGGAWTGSASLYAVTYPLNYYIHINDFEVYMFINYSTDFWQYCAFGQSAIPLPGTGLWVSASLATQASLGDAYIPRSGCYISGSGFQNYSSLGLGTTAGPFSILYSGHGYTYVNQCNSFTHTALNTVAPWSLQSTSSVDLYNGFTLSPKLSLIPNAFNAEAVLLPVAEYYTHTGGYRSLVNDLKHCKITRNNYYQPGQVITIGTEKWKIYPVVRKNAFAGNGDQDNYNYHSGTIALAIRYDGP